MTAPFRAVAIGGGGGTVQVLLGLRKYTSLLAGVIAVTDTGRSTGKVRDLARIPAPGDIRNALGTLSAGNGDFEKLIQHRLKVPHVSQLDGVAFGNLMLAALTQMTGNFGTAVDTMRAMLGVTVDILPVTTHNTHICAELVDGTLLEQELNVRALGKPAIKHVFIQDRMARVYPPVLAAIAQADLITVGPGSLFTSILACLAFDELSNAIAKSPAKTVYVCNNTTQPGQTDGYDLYDHVSQIKGYLNGRLDTVLINTRKPSDQLREHYAQDGVEVLLPDASQLARIRQLGVKIVARDLAQLTDSKRELWDKQDSIRHDPDAVASSLIEILSTQQP